MKVLPILTKENPSLRTKCAEVLDIEDSEIQTLIRDMKETMKRAGNSIGLAAPQVGRNIRLILVKAPLKRCYVLINPKITRKSKETMCDQEGCLSFPGEYYDVERAKEIKVKAFDETGRKFNLKAKKLEARIIQHEVDHLDGILFTDRVSEQEDRN